jgi:glycosyltransferase involved in cell wall biosynthesis
MRDLVREFAAQGHEPTVIVPAAALTKPYLLDEESGIRTLRVKTPPTKDVGYVRRTLNEMRLSGALLRGMRAASIPCTGWDGILWYSPTIFLGPIVKRLRLASGCRSYLILRDIFPEWAVHMGLMGKGPPYWFFKWIEAGQYAVADTIGVQCQANMPYLKEWASGPGRRLEVLENWLSPAPVGPCRIKVDATPLAGRKIFVYTGNMGVAQGMDVFLQLATRMRHDARIGFLFVGRGSEAARLAAEAKQAGLTNVMFHDEIEPDEIPGLLAQCHVGLLALDPRHRSHNIPGKFLSYMQAGLSVLARVNPGNDLIAMIEKEGVGRVCVGEDPTVLETLASEFVAGGHDDAAARRRAHELWERRFSTAGAVQQIVEAIEGGSHGR